jgi:hypothetical protein
MINEFIGLTGDNHAFAVLHQRAEATLHLQAIGDPEKELRSRILAACSELTHSMQKVSWGLCQSFVSQ